MEDNSELERDSLKIYYEMGPFVAIPLSFLEAGFDFKAKLVFMCLRRYTNRKNGKAWPSYPRMMEFTGLSRASIARALEALEKKGWISRHPRHSKSTEYTLKIPKPAVSHRDAGRRSGRLEIEKEIRSGDYEEPEQYYG
jgi:SOS-response transcriptional repressor LexA